MNRQELIDEINRLEQERAQRLQDQAKVAQDIKETESEFDILQKALDEARRKWSDCRSNLDNSRVKLRNGKYALDALNDDIDAARRELARALDTEKLNEQYAAEVESYREKTLKAPWLKENRTDGIGAFDYQIDGAIHLAITKHVLFGDKRGLGKSLGALAAVDLAECSRILILSPPDLSSNLIRELQLWTPHRNVWTFEGMTREQRQFLMDAMSQEGQFAAVLPYTVWRKDKTIIPDLIKLKAEALIMDEAHHAKSLTTLTAKGLKQLRFAPNYCPGGCEQPVLDYLDANKVRAECMNCGHRGSIAEFSSLKYVIPMTGSAIMNRPQDLFPHLHMVDPIGFPSEKAYLRDFCLRDTETGRWGWGYGGQERVVKKIGPRYFARTREDVGLQIPPAKPVDHIISYDEMKENYPAQWKAYEQGRKFAQIVLDPENETVVTMSTEFEILMRLRQILVWPDGIELKYREKDGDFVKETIVGRLEIGESIKLDKAQEIIVENHEEGDRTVLFSMFKPGLHVLKKRLTKLGLRVGVYDGSTSRYEKNEIEKDFDPKYAPDKPKFDVLLANYKSAGEGLNFNAAGREILLDRYWNHAGEDQAEGRIDRIGTTEQAIVDKLMVDTTVDMFMRDLVEEKRSISDMFENEAALARAVYDDIINGRI